MQSDDKVVAILCADLHLSAKPPRCRAGEPDWYAAMARPLDEIDILSEDYGDVPVLVAGDLFDRWNSPPELINFALNCLPRNLHAISGQHDLPYHRLDLMDRGAYGTLVIAGKIRDTSLRPRQLTDEIIIRGFPWGVDIVPCAGKDNSIHVALVHRFIWRDKATGYEGVSDAEHIKQYRKALKGYNVVVFGDNHKGFMSRSKNTGQIFFNCGTMMRRTISEVDYRPRVGLLHASGEVTIHYLDTSEDILTVPDEVAATSTDLREFSNSLADLANDPLDFRDAVRRSLPNCSDGAAKVLTDTLESYEED